MINKLAYKKVQKKWEGFSVVEKIFIWYFVVIFALLRFLPVLQIPDSNWNGYQTFALVNSYFKSWDLIVFLLLIFGFLRNISSRFKNAMIKLIGIKDVEAIVNFGIILSITLSILAIASFVALVHNEISEQITLIYSNFNLLNSVLLAGLILTFITWLHTSTQNKRHHLWATHIDFDNEQPQNDIGTSNLFEEVEEI